MKEKIEKAVTRAFRAMYGYDELGIPSLRRIIIYTILSFTLLATVVTTMTFADEHLGLRGINALAGISIGALVLLMLTWIEVGSEYARRNWALNSLRLLLELRDKNVRFREWWSNFDHRAHWPQICRHGGLESLAINRTTVTDVWLAEEVTKILSAWASYENRYPEQWPDPPGYHQASR